MNRALKIPGLCAGSDAKEIFSSFYCISQLLTIFAMQLAGMLEVVARNFTDIFDNIMAASTGWPLLFLLTLNILSL